MCGRYVLEGPVSRLTTYFDARYTKDESLFKNSYNIAPTTQVPVVRINREGERVILNHVWGLIPHWSKDKTVSAKLNNFAEKLFMKNHHFEQLSENSVA